MIHTQFVKRNERIKQMAVEKMPIEEIAKITNLGTNRVRMILKSSGIKPYRKSNALQKEPAKTIITLLAEGEKQIEIARKVGVSRQYVNQVKKRLDALKEL